MFVIARNIVVLVDTHTTSKDATFRAPPFFVTIINDTIALITLRRAIGAIALTLYTIPFILIIRACVTEVVCLRITNNINATSTAREHHIRFSLICLLHSHLFDFDFDFELLLLVDGVKNYVLNHFNFLVYSLSKHSIQIYILSFLLF
jgi:hypothetical protein